MKISINIIIIVTSPESKYNAEVGQSQRKSPYRSKVMRYQPSTRCQVLMSLSKIIVTQPNLGIIVALKRAVRKSSSKLSVQAVQAAGTHRAERFRVTTAPPGTVGGGLGEPSEDGQTEGKFQTSTQLLITGSGEVHWVWFVEIEAGVKVTIVVKPLVRSIQPHHAWKCAVTDAAFQVPFQVSCPLIVEQLGHRRPRQGWQQSQLGCGYPMMDLFQEPSRQRGKTVADGTLASNVRAMQVLYFLRLPGRWDDLIVEPHDDDPVRPQSLEGCYGVFNLLQATSGWLTIGGIPAADSKVGDSCNRVATGTQCRHRLWMAHPLCMTVTKDDDVGHLWQGLIIQTLELLGEGRWRRLVFKIDRQYVFYGVVEHRDVQVHRVVVESGTIRTRVQLHRDIECLDRVVIKDSDVHVDGSKVVSERHNGSGNSMIGNQRMKPGRSSSLFYRGISGQLMPCLAKRAEREASTLSPQASKPPTLRTPLC